MTFVERTGETIARSTLNRRKLLGRAAGTVFTVMTTWTLGANRERAYAAIDGCYNKDNLRCGCVACYETYCTTLNAGYCSGEKCAGGCTYFGGCGYPTSPGYGCWCTKYCQTGSTCNTATGGYWMCCDCLCPGNRKCSCRRFVKVCGPGVGTCC